jgi:hypothetical protein
MRIVLLRCVVRVCLNQRFMDDRDIASMDRN